MPMDQETFADIFGSLPSAPTDLRRRFTAKFSVPAKELDLVFVDGWSVNTFNTSTTCRVMLNKPIELSLFQQKKVVFDHSACPRCQSQTLITKYQPVKRTVSCTSFMRMSFSRERSKQITKTREMPSLSWAKKRTSTAEKTR